MNRRLKRYSLDHIFDDVREVGQSSSSGHTCNVVQTDDDPLAGDWEVRCDVCAYRRIFKRYSDASQDRIYHLVQSLQQR